MDKKQDQKAYAHAEKAYMQGTLFSYIKVGMQKVNLTPTVNIVNGEKVITPNAPVYIYDTSGPFSDPNMEIDLKKGLPRIRESWITGRGDVEQLPSITSEYGKMRRDDNKCFVLIFLLISIILLFYKGNSVFSSFPQSFTSALKPELGSFSGSTSGIRPGVFASICR